MANSMKNKDENISEELRNMFEKSAQQSTQYFTEEQMHQVWQDCYATGVPMAVYVNKAASATLTPFSLPRPHRTKTIEGVALYETHMTKTDGGWVSQQCLIDVCDSIPALAHACMQTIFYAMTLHPWADGEALCKYADLLRYVGLHEDAVRWYKLSNAAGFHWGAYNVGVYYQKGTHIEQNHDLARLWYERAVELGSGEAQDRLRELN